jgi:hypothetical protein
MRSFITMIAGAHNYVLSNAKAGSIVVVLATLTQRVLETTRFLFARLNGRAALCYAPVSGYGDQRSSARSHRMHARQRGGMPCQGWRLVKQAPDASVCES